MDLVVGGTTPKGARAIWFGMSLIHKVNSRPTCGHTIHCRRAHASRAFRHGAAHNQIASGAPTNTAGVAVAKRGQSRCACGPSYSSSVSTNAPIHGRFNLTTGRSGIDEAAAAGDTAAVEAGRPAAAVAAAEATDAPAAACAPSAVEPSPTTPAPSAVEPSSATTAAATTSVKACPAAATTTRARRLAPH